MHNSCASLSVHKPYYIWLVSLAKMLVSAGTAIVVFPKSVETSYLPNTFKSSETRQEGFLHSNNLTVELTLIFYV